MSLSPSAAVVIGCAVLAVTAVVAARRPVQLLVGESPRWPLRVLAPLLAAVGGAGAAWLATTVPELVGLVVLACAGALLVAADVACHRLPDAVLLPAGGILLVALTVAAVTTGEPGRFGRAVLAGAALGAAYLLMAMISPSAIGLGDVKLAAVLGVFLGWFGWSAVLVGTLAAFVLGGLVALVLLAARRVRRTTTIAFGPWLVAGAAVGAAWPVGL